MVYSKKVGVRRKLELVEKEEEGGRHNHLPTSRPTTQNAHQVGMV